MSNLTLLKDQHELRDFLAVNSGTLGFVPTMGALHRGHGSLIARSARENSTTIVSVFVNPKQFGPKEDFNRYPRTLEADMELAQRSGAQAVYAPALEEVYPSHWCTAIEVEGITDALCGKFRPGHFRGVATVVYRLFQLVNPRRAYFGEKDFQQCLVVERMVKDLAVPVEIVRCPTERSESGLALSSRNTYLSKEGLFRASGIYGAMEFTRKAAMGGGKDREQLEKILREALFSIPGFELQYGEILDEPTLGKNAPVGVQSRVFVAGYLEGVRLIDNLAVF